MFGLFVLCNVIYILIYNKLWIPLFFISAYHFTPTNFFVIAQTTPLPCFIALGLGYLLHHWKSPFDASKITFNNSKLLLINADRRFPIGFLVIFSILTSMPEIFVRMYESSNLLSKADLARLLPLIKALPYIHIFIAGYFCSLGAFYTYKSLTLPSKK